MESPGRRRRATVTGYDNLPHRRRCCRLVQTVDGAAVDAAGLERLYLDAVRGWTPLVDYRGSIVGGRHEAS